MERALQEENLASTTTAREEVAILAILVEEEESGSTPDLEWTGISHEIFLSLPPPPRLVPSRHAKPNQPTHTPEN